MKRLLQITFLFFSILGYSQNFDFLIDASYNKLDDRGLKNGLWIEYKITTLNYLHVFKSIEDDSTYFDTNNSKNQEINSLMYILNAGFYNHGLKDSIWYFFNLVDDLHSKIYLNDTIYSGGLIYMAKFKNDTLNGFLKTFYPNTILRSEVNFENGILIGSVKCYYLNGNLKYEGKIFANNSITVGTNYSQDGYKIREGNFNLKMILEDCCIPEEFKKRIKIE